MVGVYSYRLVVMKHCKMGNEFMQTMQLEAVCGELFGRIIYKIIKYNVGLNIWSCDTVSTCSNDDV